MEEKVKRKKREEFYHGGHGVTRREEEEILPRTTRTNTNKREFGCQVLGVNYLYGVVKTL